MMTLKPVRAQESTAGPTGHAFQGRWGVVSHFAGLIEILTGQACEQGSNGPFCEIASVETRLVKIVKRVNEIEPKRSFHSDLAFISASFVSYTFGLVVTASMMMILMMRKMIVMVEGV